MFSIGIPKDSVIQYETALKADNFLVMVHGSKQDTIRARAILGIEKPSRLEVYTSGKQTRDVAAVTA